MQTFTFEGMPDGVALEKIRFEALPGGRTRHSGVVEGYEQLDEVLTAS